MQNNFYENSSHQNPYDIASIDRYKNYTSKIRIILCKEESPKYLVGMALHHMLTTEFLGHLIVSMEPSCQHYAKIYKLVWYGDKIKVAFSHLLDTVGVCFCSMYFHECVRHLELWCTSLVRSVTWMLSMLCLSDKHGSVIL